MCELCGNDDCDGAGLPEELADLDPREVLAMLASAAAEIVGGGYRPKARYQSLSPDGEQLVHGRNRHDFNYALDGFLARYIDGLDASAAGAPMGELAERAEQLADDMLAFFSNDPAEAMYALRRMRSDAAEVMRVREQFRSGGYPGGSNRMDV